MVELDGRHGEGGGQILRTALALSAVTATPFRIDGIRVKRSRPGLLRQHLTGVLAAAELCGAQVDGAVLGSTDLTFRPGPIRSGDFTFAVGTAGSVNLVLQTVLPILLRAPGPSVVTVTGGTHNPDSPPWHYLAETFLPLLRQMGADVETRLDRWGFYPAGGGSVTLRAAPSALRPIRVDERGDVRLRGFAVVAGGLRVEVAKRELGVLGERLSIPPDRLRFLKVDSLGPGNCVWVEAVSAGLTEIFTGFGQKGVAAELVAHRVADAVEAWLATGAPVGEHLADQLLIPLAMAGGGGFLTHAPSEHTLTNIEVIRRFLPVSFSLTEIGGLTRVDVRPEA